MHQYEVLHTLGVGKHGEVKKAIHKLSGCPVSFADRTVAPLRESSLAMRHVSFRVLFFIRSSAFHIMVVEMCHDPSP